MFNRIFHHVLPVQILHLLPDNPEDFPKFLISASFQVHYFGNSIESLAVRNLEGADVGVDSKFQHSWMDVHISLLEIGKGGLAPPLWVDGYVVVLLAFWFQGVL
jgi:hypothetical protein